MDESISIDNPSQQLNSFKQLQKIRNFNGESDQFWKMLLTTLIGICEAEAGIICLRSAEGWQTVAGSTDTGPDGFSPATLLQSLIPEAEKASSQRGFAHLQNPEFSILAVNLFVDTNPNKCLSLFYCNVLAVDEAMQKINLLLSHNDLPARYRLQQAGLDAMKNQRRWTDILDLIVLVNGQKRFIAAAMTTCNELAGRYNCERVSIGWLTKGTIRVKAMSHTDNFEKKMEAVGQLELAMEEAVNQDNDVVFPAPENSLSIVRDHVAYAKAQDVSYMASFPLRNNDEFTGVICFERSEKPFTDTDLRQIRISLDLITTRLAEVFIRDRWIGARLAGWSREQLARLLGFEHTWAKAFGLLGAAALLVVTLLPVRYRVDSPMILRTDDVSYITAPFDGYIENVHVKAGDAVHASGTLMSLDKKDLLLEEAGLIAERNRQSREVEKARAAAELADMCIAQARLDQAIARLDINHYKLKQAEIVSPFDGVIIEGDQLERIGSPVRQGEVLFRVGGVRALYTEAKVSENEIHHIKIGSIGQIALASRPQAPYNIVVDLVEPSAVVAEKDNVFLVRCKFTDPVAPSLKPGMTGISKINAGKKTLLWIVGHRTIDFLRLKLWW